MRIVREHRVTVRAARCIDGPLVRPRAEQRRIDVQQPAAGGPRAAAQVDHGRSGDRQRHVATGRVAFARTDERPIEARRRWRQELVDGGGYRVVQCSLRALERVVVRQHRVEREHHEQAVLALPRSRPCAEQPVLGRSGAQISEPGVHALRIRLEPGALLGRQPREQRVCARAKLERSLCEVRREGALAEQCRELTGGGAPREVHLEEPLLRVHVALAAQRVGERGRVNRRYGARIEVDRHGCLETGHRRLPGAPRQRRREQRVGCEREHQQDAEQCAGQAFRHVESPLRSAYRRRRRAALWRLERSRARSIQATVAASGRRGSGGPEHGEGVVAGSGRSRGRARGCVLVQGRFAAGRGRVLLRAAARRRARARLERRDDGAPARSRDRAAGRGRAAHGARGACHRARRRARGAARAARGRPASARPAIAAARRPPRRRPARRDLHATGLRVATRSSSSTA